MNLFSLLAESVIDNFTVIIGQYTERLERVQ
jgi:hypothetical protein